MPDTEMGKTWSTLPLIAGHARRDSTFRFTSLAHLLNEEFLRDCYHRLKKTAAAGIDQVSWEDYGQHLDVNLQRLVKRLKNKSYKPLPAKRVYIPKNETETRPLGIGAVESKIVERGLTWIMESIYEQDFLDCSHGFRPGRSCHQALRSLHEMISFQPVNHIVEADIRQFFDRVPHDTLMDFLRIRIGDPRLLDLIKKLLSAGYVDDQQLVVSEQGVPQGSIHSPLLANVYLHYVLDTWFAETVTAHTRGYCELVRYADDFVCVVRYADDAERIERALMNRFKRYGLELHPDKSRRISFGRFERENAKKQGRRANTFDFLGFMHFCDTSRKGKFKLGRKTSRKKFAAKCREMHAWLKRIRNATLTKNWWKVLQAKLRGHYQYYGVSENYAGINRFYHKTLRMVRYWLNRRSQKRKMSWKRFDEYVQHYPLPKPRIAHDFYNWSPER